MSRVILPLEPIAVLTHNHRSESPLHSWPPVPADDLHQGELLALHTFGSLLKGIRSPRHIYYASWRDPDPSAYLATDESQAPTGVLFGAQFGLAPFETSLSLEDTANMFNQLDRAQLRLDLTRREDGSLGISWLELELNEPSSGTDRSFRSCWTGEEAKQLDLSVHFQAPETRAGSFRFHMSGRLPRRANRNAPIQKEHVEFTASGGAMPLPSWFNY